MSEEDDSRLAEYPLKVELGIYDLRWLKRAMESLMALDRTTPDEGELDLYIANNHEIPVCKGRSVTEPILLGWFVIEDDECVYFKLATDDQRAVDRQRMLEAQAQREREAVEERPNGRQE